MTTAKPMSENTKNVLEAIIANPGKTSIDIATILSVSVGSVSGAVGSLKRAELITADENGKFTATAEAAFEFGDGDTTPAAKTEKPTTAAAGDTEDDSTDTGASTIVETTGTAAPETVTIEAAATKAAASPKVPAAEKAPATESKAAKARKIFDENPGAPRKLLMSLLMGPECGMTEAGANTYIYNIRKTKGLVTARGTAPAVAETPAAVVTETTAAPTIAAGEEPAFAAEPTEAVIIDVTTAGVASPETESTVVETTPADEEKAAQ